MFEPFVGADDAVAVEVGTEVAMAYDGADVVESLELGDEHMEHGALFGGAGVAGGACFIEAAFVADADAVGVVVAGVGAGLANGSHEVNFAIASDVEMVAAAAETATDVVGFELCGAVVLVATGG